MLILQGGLRVALHTAGERGYATLMGRTDSRNTRRHPRSMSLEEIHSVQALWTTVWAQTSAGKSKPTGACMGCTTEPSGPGP